MTNASGLQKLFIFLCMKMLFFLSPHHLEKVVLSVVCSRYCFNWSFILLLQAVMIPSSSGETTKHFTLVNRVTKQRFSSCLTGCGINVLSTATKSHRKSKQHPSGFCYMNRSKKNLNALDVFVFTYLAVDFILLLTKSQDVWLSSFIYFGKRGKILSFFFFFRWQY